MIGQQQLHLVLRALADALLQVVDVAAGSEGAVARVRGQRAADGQPEKGRVYPDVGDDQRLRRLGGVHLRQHLQLAPVVLAQVGLVVHLLRRDHHLKGGVGEVGAGRGTEVVVGRVRIEDQRLDAGGFDCRRKGFLDLKSGFSQGSQFCFSLPVSL